MQIDHSKRVFGLDLIRACAISLVIISHTTLLVTGESQNGLILMMRALGALGVDIFFVLSGYLIGGILLDLMTTGKNTFANLRTFWKRRWMRTLPAYYLVLILNVLLALFVGVDLPDNIGLYFLFLQNFFSSHPDFFTEAWSLSIEEYAYLLLPFLFYFFIRFLKTKPEKTFLRATLGIITILFLVKVQYLLSAEVEFYKDWSHGFRKVVIYRLDSIYIGFLLVYFISKKQLGSSIEKMGFYLGSLGLFLMHAIIFWLDVMPETQLWFYALLYLPCVCLLLAIMFPYTITWKCKNPILRRMIYFVSTRSYSMYLVNYSMVLLSLQYYFRIEDFGLWLKIGVILVYLMATIVLSQIIYKYFEKPIMDLRPKL